MKHKLPDAVREYLAAYKYKIELHAHTYPASGCSRLSPSELIAALKKENYDAVVITNHLFYDHGEYRKSENPIETYLKDFYEAKKEGEKQGIKVLLGSEFRFLENENDYLVFGVDKEFLEKTLHRADLTLKSFYEEFHDADDLLIIQAHPRRKNGVIMSMEYLDGLEIMNMHPGHNSLQGITAKYAAENNVPIVIAGTDLHHKGHEGVAAIKTRILPENEKELIEILRSGDFIFDIGGYPMLPYTL